MILNQADNVMISRQEVQKVYLGNALIWERNKRQYDETKIAVVRLDENMQETDDIHEFDNLSSAYSYVSSNRNSMYHVHGGNRCGSIIPTWNTAANYISNLYSVDVPVGAVSLCPRAFYECDHLEIANLPDMPAIRF